MPLQDHFRPPLSLRRHWHAFHNAWATYLASHLNQNLPTGYFAEANVQFGIEVDVATMEEAEGYVPGEAELATTVATWIAPAPTQTVPLSIITDAVEVLVFDRSAGPTLAGAIELISPANKDRPAHRDAFVSKCAAYLHQGLGLVIVDIVTDRGGNLHDDLLRRLGVADSVPLSADLYTAAYRPIEREQQSRLDIWQESLAVGGPLPTLPLWLRGNLSLPVALDATYERTCRELRILVDG
jgi:hypothetical protein